MSYKRKRWRVTPLNAVKPPPKSNPAPLVEGGPSERAKRTSIQSATKGPRPEPGGVWEGMDGHCRSHLEKGGEQGLPKGCVCESERERASEGDDSPDNPSPSEARQRRVTAPQGQDPSAELAAKSRSGRRAEKRLAGRRSYLTCRCLAGPDPLPDRPAGSTGSARRGGVGGGARRPRSQGKKKKHAGPQEQRRGLPPSPGGRLMAGTGTTRNDARTHARHDARAHPLPARRVRANRPVPFAPPRPAPLRRAKLVRTRTFPISRATTFPRWGGENVRRRCACVLLRPLSSLPSRRTSRLFPALRRRGGL